VSKPVDLGALEAVLARWVPNATGVAPASDSSVNDDGEIAPDGEPSFDQAMLANLARLEAPDGSRLLTVLIGTFVSQGADRLAALRQAAEAGDRNRLREIAHELRGASANLGARRLARGCGELEQVAIPAGLPQWREQVAAIEEEFENVKKELAYVSLALP
jgi:two-component system, sensor histidine kinase and response regulator